MYKILRYKMHYIVEKELDFASCAIAYKKNRKKSLEIIRIYTRPQNFNLLIKSTNILINKLNEFNIDHNTIDFFKNSKINLKNLITFIKGEGL